MSRDQIKQMASSNDSLSASLTESDAKLSKCQLSLQETQACLETSRKSIERLEVEALK